MKIGSNKDACLVLAKEHPVLFRAVLTLGACLTTVAVVAACFVVHALTTQEEHAHYGYPYSYLYTVASCLPGRWCVVAAWIACAASAVISPLNVLSKAAVLLSVLGTTCLAVVLSSGKFLVFQDDRLFGIPPWLPAVFLAALFALASVVIATERDALPFAQKVVRYVKGFELTPQPRSSSLVQNIGIAGHGHHVHAPTPVFGDEDEQHQHEALAGMK